MFAEFRGGAVRPPLNTPLIALVLWSSARCPRSLGCIMCPKNEIRVILNIFYSCKSIATKLVVSTLYVDLPDITQKLKRDIDELKHWHLGPYSSRHHRQSHWPVANMAGCMHKGNWSHFEHLLWSTHTTGSILEPLTRQIRYFQSHSHYWEEDSISFFCFFCVCR